MHNKILVIDDAPDEILALARYLAPLGETLAATSGEEGLVLARRQLPDLIVLDALMDGLDGYQVLVQLKAEPALAGIPVIMVTADRSPESETRALQAGASDFIGKPANPQTLQTRATLQLQLAQQRRQLEASHRELEAKVNERTAELNVAKEAAESASRAKSNFLGNMSHEMRTPLHQILGLNSLLLRRLADDPKNRETLLLIQDAGNRLTYMIDGILQLTAMESRTLQLSIDEFDLKSLLNNVLNTVSERAKKKNLTLSASTGDVPSQLWGDARLLKIALLCYVNNGLTYTEKGQVHLGSEVLSQEGDSLMLRIWVSDTGPGIASELIPKLFSLFEQGDSSSTRRFGGTGLGLYLVKRLAVEMGGDAGCDSEPGKGSRFWLTLRCYLKRPTEAGCCVPGACA